MSYEVQLIPAGGNAVWGRHPHTPTAGASNVHAPFCILRPKGYITTSRVPGMTVADARLLVAETLSAQPRVGHPGGLMLGRDKLTAMLGPAVGQIIYAGHTGAPSYENVTYALRHGNAEMTDQRPVTFVAGDVPDDLPCAEGGEEWLLAILNGAAQVYGVRGEIIRPEQFRDTLCQHSVVGPMFRRWYETKGQTTIGCDG